MSLKQSVEELEQVWKKSFAAVPPRGAMGPPQGGPPQGAPPQGPPPEMMPPQGAPPQGPPPEMMPPQGAPQQGPPPAPGADPDIVKEIGSLLVAMDNRLSKLETTMQAQETIRKERDKLIGNTNIGQ